MGFLGYAGRMTTYEMSLPEARRQLAGSLVLLRDALPQDGKREVPLEPPQPFDSHRLNWLIQDRKVIVSGLGRAFRRYRQDMYRVVEWDGGVDEASQSLALTGMMRHPYVPREDFVTGPWLALTLGSRTTKTEPHGTLHVSPMLFERDKWTKRSIWTNEDEFQVITVGEREMQYAPVTSEQVLAFDAIVRQAHRIVASSSMA